MGAGFASTQLKGTTVNLTVVAVYAPTLNAAEEAKDSFYDDLQDAVDRVPVYAIPTLIVIPYLYVAIKAPCGPFYH